MNKKLENIQVVLDVRLGKKSISLMDAESIGEGSIIELDKDYGDAVDVYINDKLIAFGEVVVIDDKFGIRICDVVEPSTKKQEEKKLSAHIDIKNFMKNTKV
jgi:flagellar motor switch protein FliN/FliY